MKIRREQFIELTTEEELEIVKKYVFDKPEIIKIMQRSTKKMIHCPFPDDCKQFPCGKLYCNADVCSNGHAYRMS